MMQGRALCLHLIFCPTTSGKLTQKLANSSHVYDSHCAYSGTGGVSGEDPWHPPLPKESPCNHQTTCSLLHHPGLVPGPLMTVRSNAPGVEELP